MRTALFYDTETQGLPLFNEPSDDPRQPHIVQVAACLVDIDSRKTLSSFDVTVTPDSWTIPDDVAKIHGITTDIAAAIGISESMAVGMVLSLWERADVRIGHNEQFDARILRIAILRNDGPETAEHWANGAAQCTQALSTPILKLPPTARMIAAGFKKNKSANLGEAYQFFTGKPLEGAHRAMVDVTACMDVYFAIQDRALAAAA